MVESKFKPHPQNSPFVRTVLRFWGLLALSWASGGAPALWVIDPQGLPPAEQVLLASLQGNLNRTNAVLWVRGRGANAWVLEELRAEGWDLQTNATVWSVLAESRSHLAGYLTYQLTNASLNIATSLAGPRRAVLADVSLRERLESLGLRELLHVTETNEHLAFSRYQSEFARGLAVHQPITKPLHLRDFAVARNAFTFFEGSSAQHRERFRELGPGTRVFGWGVDEHDFIQDVSAGGGLVVPSDWALNLSALAHLPTKLSQRPFRPEPTPLKPGERVVAFVVTDGDNVQWLLNGFVDSPGFWASPGRGTFPVTWELAPSLAELAPRVLAHLYRTATPFDDFVAGPSGAGYYFPSRSPHRAELAAVTGRSLPAAQLRAVSLLNSGGGLEAADEVLVQPSVDGVLFKDYAPYHRWAGSIRWHAGKPAVSYRYLLWEQKQPDGTLRPDWLPEGVATAVANLPANAAAADRFALVNVHAWSFRDSGGPMGAIRRTLALLPPDIRIVTVTEFLKLLPRPDPR